MHSIATAALENTSQYSPNKYIFRNNMGRAEKKYCAYCRNETGYAEHFFEFCDGISLIWIWLRKMSI